MAIEKATSQFFFHLPPRTSNEPAANNWGVVEGNKMDEPVGDVAGRLVYSLFVSGQCGEDDRKHPGQIFFAHSK